MITQDTPIEKQIQFFESKINQYCDVIKANPKGEENVRLWIEHLTGWNNEIIELKKQLEENGSKKF